MAIRRTDKAMWQDLWTSARLNMPKRYKHSTGWATLGLLIFGRKNTHGTAYNHTRKGLPPDTPEQEELLRKLAGPYGKVFAKVIMIKRNIDPNQYKWH